MLNPFVWNRPLDDPAQVVGMDTFAATVARRLQGRTNIVMFGPRGTGKTSFVTKLAGVLATGDLPHAMLRVNLETAVSLQAIVGCVQTALDTHPDRRLRRRAVTLTASLEKTIGVNVRFVTAQVKRSQPQHPDDHVLLEQLRNLTRLADNIVVVFDEVQRLADCAGEPLSIIRAALLAPEAANTSLMFTGSYRKALHLMTTAEAEPLFNQAHHVELPGIPFDKFADYIDLAFAATGLGISEEAIDYLLAVSQCHPRRTQQLAWHVWEQLVHEQSGAAGIIDVETALDAVLAGYLGFDAPDPETEPREYRTLLLLADHGSDGMTSPSVLSQYGIRTHKTLYRAIERLDERAVIYHRNGRWRIVDPLLAEWLRRRSPFARQA